MYIIVGILALLALTLIIALVLASRQAKYKKVYLYDGDSNIRFPDRIHKILAWAMRNKVPFSVRLKGSENTYTSYLLRIIDTKKEKQIFIDSLVPEEGNDLIKDAENVFISFVLKEDEVTGKNIPYEFSTSFIKEITSEGPKQFVLHFPKELVRKQRREYLRVSPPEKNPAFIYFSLNGVEHRCKIIDISGGGVAFSTDLDDAVLGVGTELHDVTIEIPGSPNVSCIAIVHKKIALGSFNIEAKRKNVYICGAKFKEIKEEERQVIIKYVVNIEREELKRLRASPVAADLTES